MKRTCSMRDQVLPVEYTDMAGNRRDARSRNGPAMASSSSMTLFESMVTSTAPARDGCRFERGALALFLPKCTVPHKVRVSAAAS